ncbi:MAG: permease-like cell division protein FtsX [Patescibacteria group bacterium]
MEVLRNIRRTPFQSTSMFLIQFFSAFLLLTSISATIFLVAIFNKVETQIPVIVYFKPATKEADILKLREQLIKSGKVANLDYIDKKKAFEFYKTQNQNNPLLLEMTSEDNFPPSFEIQAKDPRYLFEIANFFKSEPGVDEVQFEKQTVQRLVTVTNILRTSVFVLATYLALMSIITLVTMVMFKIALRREEIELSQLLGATRGKISRPFFDEGNIITIMSTTTAIGLFLGLLFIVKDAASAYLFGIKSLSLPISTVTFDIWPLNIMTIGSLVGVVFVYIFIMNVLSTKIATDKYIK